MPLVNVQNLCVSSPTDFEDSLNQIFYFLLLLFFKIVEKWTVVFDEHVICN